MDCSVRSQWLLQGAVAVKMECFTNLTSITGGLIYAMQKPDCTGGVY